MKVMPGCDSGSLLESGRVILFSKKEKAENSDHVTLASPLNWAKDNEVMLKTAKQKPHTHIPVWRVSQLNSRYLFWDFIFYTLGPIRKYYTSQRQERHWVRQEELFVLAFQGRLADLNPSVTIGRWSTLLRKENHFDCTYQRPGTLNKLSCLILTTYL